MASLAGFSNMNKIFSIILICCCNSIHAQQSIEPVDSIQVEQLQPVPSDSSLSNIISGDTILLIHEIEFPMDSMASLKNKKAFLYLKKLDSILKAKQVQEDLNIQGKGSRNISLFDRFMNTSFVKLFLWAIAIMFIFFILYNLFLSKGIFRKPSASVHIDEQNDTSDNFPEQDFRKLVSQSCKLADYRMAVRYLFLLTLQKLNERLMIEYAADKTNSDYAREISQDKRNEFASLVLNYEYIWYGNISITKSVYDNVENKFSSFLNKI